MSSRPQSSQKNPTRQKKFQKLKTRKFQRAQFQARQVFHPNLGLFSLPSSLRFSQQGWPIIEVLEKFQE